MQKRNLALSIFFGIMLIGFVSAYYGSYTDFSIDGVLDNIDGSTMVFGSLFMIFFAFIFYILSRVFKDRDGNPNRAIAGLISFASSVLILYGLYTSDMDLSGILMNIGIGEELMGSLGPIIMVGGAIFIVWRMGLAAFFLIFGVAFLLISVFTDWVYERGLVIAIGIGFILIGLWLKKRGSNKKRYDPYGYSKPGMFSRFNKWRSPDEKLRRLSSRRQLKDAKRAERERRKEDYGNAGKAVGGFLGRRAGNIKNMMNRGASGGGGGPGMSQAQAKAAIDALYRKNAGRGKWSSADKAALREYQKAFR